MELRTTKVPKHSEDIIPLFLLYFHSAKSNFPFQRPTCLHLNVCGFIHKNEQRLEPLYAAYIMHNS